MSSRNSKFTDDSGLSQVYLMVSWLFHAVCLTNSPSTGHLGDVTVEHVAHHLPIIVRDFLREADPSVHSGKCSPQAISELFTNAMLAFDDAIAHDVLDLFGGSIEKLEEYTDAEIRDVINDQHLGGANWRKVRLCMFGTTALVALVDPDHQDLWIANLGDCQAGKLSTSIDYSTSISLISVPLVA